jgi:hypothetical protein
MLDFLGWWGRTAVAVALVFGVLALLVAVPLALFH